MSIESVKDLITDRIAKSDFNHVVKFDCGDQGILVINNKEVTTDDMDAECTVSITADNLLSLVKGELNPTMGFMTGKLKLDGSMGVAMKLMQML